MRPGSHVLFYGDLAPKNRILRKAIHPLTHPRILSTAAPQASPVSAGLGLRARLRPAHPLRPHPVCGALPAPLPRALPGHAVRAAGLQHGAGRGHGAVHQHRVVRGPRPGARPCCAVRCRRQFTRQHGGCGRGAAQQHCMASRCPASWRQAGRPREVGELGAPVPRVRGSLSRLPPLPSLRRAGSSCGPPRACAAPSPPPPRASTAARAPSLRVWGSGTMAAAAAAAAAGQPALVAAPGPLAS